MVLDNSILIIGAIALGFISACIYFFLYLMLGITHFIPFKREYQILLYLAPLIACIVSFLIFKPDPLSVRHLFYTLFLLIIICLIIVFGITNGPKDPRMERELREIKREQQREKQQE